MEETVTEIFDFLEIATPNNFKVPPPSTKKQADATSRE